MGRRKKSRHTTPPSPPALSPPREEALHTPFRDLKEQLRDLGKTPEPIAPPNPPVAPPPVSTSLPRIPPTQNGHVQQDQALFLAEMSDVVPLPKDRRGQKPRHRQPMYRVTTPADEAAGLADLRDLVEGRLPFTIQYTDEYMEGIAPGIDRRLAHRLHRGDYAVQAHCDLHGYTVEEARAVVERFLNQAYTLGRRCIILIHGRGRNSKDNRPVLKEHVQLWLSHGRLSRLVLAFATAPATDGGAGAVCVLLRRAPHVQKKP